ncbi:MAG: hypothetical protein WD825_00265 [Gemmatimonadaceae bacterium]
METQTPPTPAKRPGYKGLYWIAAGAMTVAGALAIIQDSDYLKAGGQFALVVALVLLATARPEETRAKKVAIWALLAIAIALLLVRVLGRSP